MILFFIIITFFLLGAIIIKDKQLRRYKKIVFFFAMLCIGIITCFRGVDIGNDTREYLALFEAVSNRPISYFVPRYEVGYICLNKVISHFFDNPQALLIITGALTWLGVGWFINKRSSNPLFSLFLILTFGFASFFMSGIRGSLSIAICLIGFQFIPKKKPILFFAFVVFAVLFHSIALAFTFAYPVYHAKLNIKQSLFVGVCTIFAVYFFDRIVIFILSYFPQYSYYIDGIYSTGGVRLASVLNFLLISIIFILCKYVCHKYHVVDQNDIGLTNLLLIGACLLLVSFKFNLLDRVAMYYTFFFVLAIPNVLLKYNETKSIWLIKSIVVTLVFVIYFSCVQYYRPEWNHIYPYHFY